MNRISPGVGAACLCFLLIMSVDPGAVVCAGQQEDVVPQVEAGDSETHQGPGNITGQVEVYVLLAWVEGMLLFAILVLRYKIKEVDRLYEIGYLAGQETGGERDAGHQV